VEPTQLITLSTRWDFVVAPRPWSCAILTLEFLWRWATGDFDYLYDRVGEGVFILTMHPQTIGRGHRLLMLERLVNYIRDKSGITFRTMAEVAAAFRRELPLVAGGLPLRHRPPR
jgi:hypothetical protein